MGKHTIQELYQMQSLSLDAKIRMTAQRVKAWYEHFDGEVYVSFSGGKDSTVLVDIVRNVCGYDDVPLVFVDTGLEYPEIKSFVKTFNNVTWLKPSMQFREVIEKYGYPFISKEVSNNVDGAKKIYQQPRCERVPHSNNKRRIRENGGRVAKRLGESKRKPPKIGDNVGNVIERGARRDSKR